MTHRCQPFVSSISLHDNFPSNIAQVVLGILASTKDIWKEHYKQISGPSYWGGQESSLNDFECSVWSKNRGCRTWPAVGPSLCVTDCFDSAVSPRDCPGQAVQCPSRDGFPHLHFLLKQHHFFFLLHLPQNFLVFLPVGEGIINKNFCLYFKVTDRNIPLK